MDWYYYLIVAIVIAFASSLVTEAVNLATSERWKPMFICLIVSAWFTVFGSIYLKIEWLLVPVLAPLMWAISIQWYDRLGKWTVDIFFKTAKNRVQKYKGSITNE